MLLSDQNFIHAIIKHDGCHAYTTGVFHCLKPNTYAPDALLMYYSCTYLSAITLAEVANSLKIAHKHMTRNTNDILRSFDLVSWNNNMKNRK
jgi:hypothetical protein